MLTIWTNHGFRPESLAHFRQGIEAAGHRLLFSPKSSASVLAAGQSDPAMAEADIAYGIPGEPVDGMNVRYLLGRTAVPLAPGGNPHLSIGEPLRVAQLSNHGRAVSRRTSSRSATSTRWARAAWKPTCAA